MQLLFSLLLLLLLNIANYCNSFHHPTTAKTFTFQHHSYSYTSQHHTTTALFSTNPPPAPKKRIPRRDLKKRPNRRRREGNSITSNTDITTKNSNNNNINNPNTTPTNNTLFQSTMFNNNNNSNTQQGTTTTNKVEKRSLIRSQVIEAGEDYWIDEVDLQKSIKREQAIQNRKSNNRKVVGSITQEKLRTEVVAPYKQNWIGLLSVFIVVLSVIGNQFPELLLSPVIPIPDL